MINAKSRTFDTRCWHLAKLFILDDEQLMKLPPATVDALVNELASEIQQTIEGFINQRKGWPL